MRPKYKIYLVLIVLQIIVSLLYFKKIKSEKYAEIDTYILLKKNVTQKQILKTLEEINIKISYLSWRIVAFTHQKKFIPKAGEYLIPNNSSIYDIQKLFHNGKTITRTFTLIEGTTAKILKNKLIRNKYLSGKVPVLFEGIYKPNTYYFKYGYPRKKLLEQMKAAQDKHLETILKSIPKDFTLKNKYDLLTLASIIQSEAKDFKDSQLVASVLINRLNKNMKLQTDATLAYGLKINGKKLTKKMLQSPNPYNTYIFRGLPPTPISYPGNNALNALKNFKKTNFLYFVSDGKGGHRFSETYLEHKKNINLWIKSIKKE